VEWSALKTDQTETLRHGFIPLMRNVITLFAFFSGGIMILKHFNYDVMSLITALGVSSLAVGLAAKDTLSNMISGFILIIDQNLRPGDRVSLSGTVGDVAEIGLRSTHIRIGDGNTLIVPNSELVNTKILNLSMPTRAISCSTSIRIPIQYSFSKIREVCLDTLSEVSKAATDRSPAVNLASLSDGHQLIQIGFWVNEMNDVGTAMSDFNERLLSRLQKEGIPLVSPGPQNPQNY
jgi:small-conductance mechanosensitive channel